MPLRCLQLQEREKKTKTHIKLVSLDTQMRELIKITKSQIDIWIEFWSPAINNRLSIAHAK